MTTLVDKLFEVDRPRTAFHAAHLDWKLLDTARLVRLLTEVGTKDSEPSGHYRLDAYYLSDALNELEGRGDTSRDELARLEFMFIEALDHTEHGIRNLEAELSETPTLFMQALVHAFKRRDGGEDPPEWQVQNSDHRSSVATAAYSLLTNASRIPGTQSDDTIDLEKLKNWLEQVRSLCREYGRAEIGDQMIGQLLSHCPKGDDGVWPSYPVREAIEDIGSSEIALGMSVGIRNSRGAMWRGEGGTQERELATNYRKWSRQIAFEHPFTSNLLEEIARSYDHDAQWWDTKASVRQRLET